MFLNIIKYFSDKKRYIKKAFWQDFTIYKNKYTIYLKKLKYSILKRKIQMKIRSFVKNRRLKNINNMTGSLKLIPMNFGSDFLDWYNNLSVIQFYGLANLLAMNVLASSLLSIVFVFYGDYLINKYQLEIKYHD